MRRPGQTRQDPAPHVFIVEGSFLLFNLDALLPAHITLLVLALASRRVIHSDAQSPVLLDEKKETFGSLMNMHQIWPTRSKIDCSQFIQRKIIVKKIRI
jgi:hypothetical protein